MRSVCCRSQLLCLQVLTPRPPLCRSKEGERKPCSWFSRFPHSRSLADGDLPSLAGAVPIAMLSGCNPCHLLECNPYLLILSLLTRRVRYFLCLDTKKVTKEKSRLQIILGRLFLGLLTQYNSPAKAGSDSIAYFGPPQQA